MMYNNYDLLANKLTKLEYALIHSTWEPSKIDVDDEILRDRCKNPHNEPGKQRLRSSYEIARDLKIQHWKTILNSPDL